MGIVAQWFLRRAMELGGLFGTLAAWYFSLSPAQQHTIGQLLSNNWGDVQLAAIIPLAVSIGGYAWSFVSTVVPHVVTRGGAHVPLERLPLNTKQNVEAAASVAKQRK